MASESPPAAHSPKAKGDAEVLSRRTFPGQVESRESVKVAPEGETSAAGQMGEQIPNETSEEGRIQFGPQPDMIPEIHMALESGEHPPSKEGGCANSTDGPYPPRGTG